MKWFKSRKKHHAECMQKLADLNANLTSKGHETYSQRKAEIKPCPKCNEAPVYSFDSRGITCMTLECVNCNESHTVSKDMDRLIKEWNEGVRSEKWTYEDDPFIRNLKMGLWG